MPFDFHTLRISGEMAKAMKAAAFFLSALRAEIPGPAVAKLRRLDQEHIGPGFASDLERTIA